MYRTLALVALSAALCGCQTLSAQERTDLGVRTTVGVYCALPAGQRPKFQPTENRIVCVVDPSLTRAEPRY